MTASAESFMNKNLYEMIGVVQCASVKEIKTAYRKKALECHPDKNPDDPKAAELFHELTRILEILLDDSARAAYDKILNAKLAAKLRNTALDSKRKKFKEELEERERRAEEASFDRRKDENKFQAEIERLRKESSKQVEMEMNYVKEQINERVKKNLAEYVNYCETQGLFRLKLKWKSSKEDENNGGYTREVLSKIFSKYGSINAVVVSSKKNGSALIEFSDSKAAMNASKLEKGLPNNKLIISWVGSIPQDISENGSTLHAGVSKGSLFPGATYTPQINQNNHVPKESSTDDFEIMVLQRLKEAEMRKKHEKQEY